MNITICQFFHWYTKPEENLWVKVAEQAEYLAKIGITHVWLPPANKSDQGINDAGYAVYDLYDLGEFDQKGTVRTKYGTKDEYVAAIEALHNQKIVVLADLVLNHRVGADENEKATIQYVKDDNREQRESDLFEAEIPVRFTFPGRNGKYSTLTWNKDCFTGVTHEGRIALIHNQYSQGDWATVMDKEFGNYDYLLGADVEFRNPEVSEDVFNWGKWFVDTTKIDGFRIDAIKHMEPDFFPEWLKALQESSGRELFNIGEFWKDDVQLLKNFMDQTGNMISLVDVPFHGNLQQACCNREYDLRQIFDGTLAREKPEAITFVENHDSQPLQMMESNFQDWFKPLAYAIILLRKEGVPCVFYPDLYSAKYTDKKDDQEHEITMNKVKAIEELLATRKEYAYGDQQDIFDGDPKTIGWIRHGVDDKPGSGCIVLISIGEGGERKLQLPDRFWNKELYDITGNRNESIKVGENGEGIFGVDKQSISVWVVRK